MLLFLPTINSNLIIILLLLNIYLPVIGQRQMLTIVIGGTQTISDAISHSNAQAQQHKA